MPNSRKHAPSGGQTWARKPAPKPRARDTAATHQDRRARCPPAPTAPARPAPPRVGSLALRNALPARQRTHMVLTPRRRSRRHLPRRPTRRTTRRHPRIRGRPSRPHRRHPPRRSVRSRGYRMTRHERRGEIRVPAASSDSGRLSLRRPASQSSSSRRPGPAATRTAGPASGGPASSPAVDGPGTGMAKFAGNEAPVAGDYGIDTRCHSRGLVAIFALRHPHAALRSSCGQAVTER
jgi:hypothetical protein